MDSENIPIGKYSIQYGIFTGLGLIAISLIFYLLDLFEENWTNYFSYLVLLTGVVISSLNFRNNKLNGYIVFGKSVSVGFLTGLYASVIIGIFTYLFLLYLGEDYILILVEKAEENIIETRPEISDDELEIALNLSKKFMTPLLMSIVTTLSYTFFSLVFALIASIFIKKEEQPI